MAAQASQATILPTVGNQFSLRGNLKNLGLVLKHQDLGLLLVEQIGICFKHNFVLVGVVHGLL